MRRCPGKTSDPDMPFAEEQVFRVFCTPFLSSAGRLGRCLEHLKIFMLDAHQSRPFQDEKGLPEMLQALCLETSGLRPVTNVTWGSVLRAQCTDGADAAQGLLRHAAELCHSILTEIQR